MRSVTAIAPAALLLAFGAPSFAETLIDDADFVAHTTGDPFDASEWYANSIVPGATLTGGSTLNFATGNATDATQMDDNNVFRYFDANRPLAVGDSLSLTADVAINSLPRAGLGGQFVFNMGFFSLNGGTGPQDNLFNTQNWQDPGSPTLSAIGLQMPVFDDERSNGRSTVSGLRPALNRTPVSPVNYFGQGNFFDENGDPTNPVDTTTPSMNRFGEFYTLTMTLTRLDDVAGTTPNKPILARLLVEASITGDFAGTQTTYMRQTVIAEERNTNVALSEYDDFDGIYFGYFGDGFDETGSPLDFTVDNVVVEFAPIPEPGSLALSTIGLVLVAMRHRRR